MAVEKLTMPDQSMQVVVPTTGKLTERGYNLFSRAFRLLNNFTGDEGGSVAGSASTKAEIKALDPADVYTVYLNENPRYGWFSWRTGDFSAIAALDPTESIYIESDVLPVTTGCWVADREDGYSVKRFGAYGDGATDDTTAIQAAIDFAVDIGGAKVIFPIGVYKTSTALTVDGQDVRLVGQVSSADMFSATTAVGSCQIEANHTVGNVIRIKNQGCSVENITINATDTRYAATSFGYINAGIRIEADDTAGRVVNATSIKNVHVLRQPGDGVVMIGTCVRSHFDRVDVDNVKGYGIIVDGGTYASRTNVSRPGQVDITNCSASRTGQMALRIGTSSTGSAELPYRFYVRNFECFFNCQIGGSYACYFHGEHITVVNSAFAGTSSTGVDDHSGAYINGRTHRYINCRFLDCNPYCGFIDSAAGGGVVTTDILFDAIYITQSLRAANFFNPAFEVDTSCQDIDFTYHEDDVSVQFPIATTSNNVRVHVKETSRFYGQYQVGNLRAIESFTLADNKSGYVTFDAACYGKIEIASSSAAGGSTTIHFRCGDASAFCAAQSSVGATVGTGTTALLGTTGTDAQLNVAAVAANPRVYIENRTGASRSYTVTVHSCSSYVKTYTAI